MRNDTFKGILCGILSAVSFGTNPLFALPLYQRGMNTCNVLLYRFFFAVLLLGVYPPLVICQSDFFSENLMMVLLLFSLWSFTLHRRWSDGRAGICAGLAALAHPGCIFFLPFAGGARVFVSRIPV